MNTNTTNTLVQQIHNEFSESEQALVNEANKILNSESTKEEANKLAELGFTSSKNVKNLTPKQRERAKELLEYHELYSKIAPQYKFITDEKRIEICKKYGIVMADVERFTGVIPDKNVRDILNFKILDDSYVIKNKKFKAGWTWNGTPSYKLSDDHLLNILPFIPKLRRRGSISSKKAKEIERDVLKEIYRRTLPGIRPTNIVTRGLKEVEIPEHIYIRGGRYDFTEDIITEVKSEIVKEDSPKMYIVSNIDQLDAKQTILDTEKMYLSHEKWQAKERERQANLMRQQDPIVLASVRGGYLIVTAWGDEASDSDVINPSNN